MVALYLWRFQILSRDCTTASSEHCSEDLRRGVATKVCMKAGSTLPTEDQPESEIAQRYTPTLPSPGTAVVIIDLFAFLEYFLTVNLSWS